MSRQSQLEDGFLRVWQATYPDAPQPERQFMFAKDDGRKWRLDFAWPSKRLAIEIDGGEFVQGGHGRGVQMRKDREKDREATKRGWRVLRYVGKDLKEAPVQMAEEIYWLYSVLPTIEEIPC